MLRDVEAYRRSDLEALAVLGFALLELLVFGTAVLPVISCFSSLLSAVCGIGALVVVCFVDAFVSDAGRLFSGLSLYILGFKCIG